MCWVFQSLILPVPGKQYSLMLLYHSWISQLQLFQHEWAPTLEQQVCNLKQAFELQHYKSTSELQW